MNIAVTGHRGMLGRACVDAVMRHGHVLRIYQAESWEHEGKRIENLDDDDLNTVEAVINCAGVVPQRHETGQAMVYSNSFAPWKLAAACDRVQARLIHVSTDCVFSLPGPHWEASPLSPKGLYGVSKATGEITYAPHLTLRTSFIGLGQWGLMAELMSQTEITASQMLLWSGNTVETVAEYLVLLAERPDLDGILHLPGEWRNRYDLCLLLKNRFNLPIEVIQDNHFFSDRRLLSIRWNHLDMPEVPALEQQLDRWKL